MSVWDNPFRLKMLTVGVDATLGVIAGGYSTSKFEGEYFNEYSLGLGIGLKRTKTFGEIPSYLPTVSTPTSWIFIIDSSGVRFGDSIKVVVLNADTSPGSIGDKFLKGRRLTFEQAQKIHKDKPKTSQTNPWGWLY